MSDDEQLTINLRHQSGSLKTVREIEREVIELYLEYFQYNINRASIFLGVSNSKLYKRYSPGLKSKMHQKTIEKLRAIGLDDVIRETVRAL